MKFLRILIALLISYSVLVLLAITVFRILIQRSKDYPGQLSATTHSREQMYKNSQWRAMKYPFMSNFTVLQPYGQYLYHNICNNMRNLKLIYLVNDSAPTEMRNSIRDHNRFSRFFPMTPLNISEMDKEIRKQNYKG